MADTSSVNRRERSQMSSDFSSVVASGLVLNDTAALGQARTLEATTPSTEIEGLTAAKAREYLDLRKSLERDLVQPPPPLTAASSRLR